MKSSTQKKHEALKDALCDICNASLRVIAERGHEADDLRRLGFSMDKANLILSSFKLRNCDVGTPEEQYRRFRAFCESHDGGGDFDNPCRGCELKQPFGCETAFANLPYKGEEGED